MIQSQHRGAVLRWLLESSPGAAQVCQGLSNPGALPGQRRFTPDFTKTLVFLILRSLGQFCFHVYKPQSSPWHAVAALPLTG